MLGFLGLFLESELRFFLTIYKLKYFIFSLKMNPRVSVFCADKIIRMQMISKINNQRAE